VPVGSQPGQQPVGVPLPSKPLDSATVTAATRVLAGAGVAAGSGSAAAAAGAAAAGGAAASQAADPLHDSSEKEAKETVQLSALSRVVQQQQDTISRQVSRCPARGQRCKPCTARSLLSAMDAEATSAPCNLLLLVLLNANLPVCNYCCC
jgi:hypothetical protein